MAKWDAEDYHKNSPEQQRWAQDFMSTLNLKGNERVLDIGCGDGKVTAELAARVPAGLVLGIDNSWEMVGFAQQRFPAQRFPNLRFQHGDASDLTFADEFDVVVSFSSLHWVTDHAPMLEGIAHSLRPHGRVHLQFGGKGNAAAILETASEVIASEPWKEYFGGFSCPWGFYGAEEYGGWLRRVGLKSKRVELIPKDMQHQGREGLEAWIRTTWLPYSQRVPEGLRSAFIAEIVDRYVEKHPADDAGMVRLGMVRLEIEAEKP